MKHLSLAPVAAVAAALFLSACNGSGFSSSDGLTSPSLPSSTSSVSMAGTWSGTTTDSNIGQQKMTWTLNQEGGVVSGTFSLGDNGSIASNGTLRATMAGRLIGFHLEIQGGGFGGVMSSCSMTVDGQASVSDDGRTLTGSYSSSMSGTLSGSLMGEACGGSVNDGRFTLTR